MHWETGARATCVLSRVLRPNGAFLEVRFLLPHAHFPIKCLLMNLHDDRDSVLGFGWEWTGLFECRRITQWPYACLATWIHRFQSIIVLMRRVPLNVSKAHVQMWDKLVSHIPSHSWPRLWLCHQEQLTLKWCYCSITSLYFFIHSKLQIAWCVHFVAFRPEITMQYIFDIRFFHSVFSYS